MFVLDDTSPKLVTDILNVTAQLKSTVDGLKNLGNDPKSMLDDIDSIMKGNVLIEKLITLSDLAKDGSSLKIVADPAQPLQVERKDTQHFYEFQEKSSKTKRQNNNDDAYDIVSQFERGEITLDSITDEQKAVLGKYTGNGGNLIDKRTGLRGSDYEYYTPKPIASGVWDVLKDLGFNGGKVLDPCAGVGIFGATSPLNAAIDAVELDQTSGTINKLINQSSSYDVTVSNFEKVASQVPDESYDSIVANVPFGNVTKRGRNRYDDKAYRDHSLESYFILRSLEKLKGGGLAAFLVPDRCVTGKGGKERDLRQMSSMKAEFLGAYRLPNKVFGAANADTITCVMFYRKFTKDALDKINGFYGTEPEILSQSNVLWDSFIEGKYFDTAEGKKHVLGEKFTKAVEGDMYSRDQLETDDDIVKIAKRMLVNKLPRTRIDWALLDTEQAMPITYNDGDVITQNGKTLQLQDGKWTAIEPDSASSNKVDLAAKAQDPYTAFVSKITLSQVDDVADYYKSMSMVMDMPVWMANVRVALAGKSPDDREMAYMPILIGMCVAQILDEEGRDSGTNFQEKYPELSQAMEKYSAAANKVKGASGAAKEALTQYQIQYKRSTGFNPIWLGVVNENASIEITADASFEGLIYKNQSKWVSIADAKLIYGHDFNPLESDDFCISDDGKHITKVDDYYIGEYAGFLKKIDQAIADAQDQEVKKKLIKQKLMATDRVTKIDPKNIEFNLFSPYVTMEEKAEFLRRFLHESAQVVDSGEGKQEIKFNISKSDSDKNQRLKYANRLASYLKTGNVSLQGIDVIGMTDAEKLKELRDLINKTNDKFNGWVKSNPRITKRLDALANDPEKMRFVQAEDTADLVVQGMKPDRKPHPYQRAFIRKMSRDFSGINGFGVGLGKTLTSLTAVQYVQSIGVKKRTMFVVPNSVLSNWHKEANQAYQSTSDCLFIGLREDASGVLKSNSKFYDEDLYSIISNKPSKIFLCTRQK